MKKILSLTLLLAMSLAVFTFLPARAEDDVNVNMQLTTTAVATDIDSSDLLEKIPSPDQLKYFRVMKREKGTLYGVRLQANQVNSTKPMLSEDGVKLEKISSPDQLKCFRVMKREKGTLYGVRLQVNNSNCVADMADDTAVSNKLGNLEKIATPQLISLYEKIQKIGTALWGVKKSGVSEDADNNVVKKQRLITGGMIECVSKAIDTKDNAMIALTKNSAEKVTVNISARGACQKTAIASTNNQAENLKECIISFQKTHKDIVTNARKEQKDIWTNYKVEMKACAVDSIVVDDNTELMIDDGGTNVIDSVLVQ
jgi:hypothetical protein